MNKQIMETLTITADREDHSVGLTGVLRIFEFSGTGEGWHNNSSVLDFCSRLEHISESMEGSAELIGSEGFVNQPEYLETFSMRVSPMNTSKLNGTISLFICVANGGSYPDRRELETRKMSGEMKVRNHRVLQFAKDMRSLMHGDVDSVFLEGDNVI